MKDYVCTDDKGNELILVTFSEKEAKKQAIKKFKKDFKSELISCKADYSQIY